ncbi:hypothetical protein CQ022_11955 [Chryseobacterium culicis]|uniref:Uncharacterized protein n=2 Tax=Chryseobacterium culicis TaxID=680127 RepID=A0A2S9D2B9_CHRCI|nr:hypothetical protein CQ022_11955 [Chryseobacterium culicis]PRB92680.1 hypothetical protein CQ033_05625 [Chryseobacterium culicis]
MDRNYFLSYGHKITLLLLLAAVGKINTKFISVKMIKPELSYRTDINNYLQPYLADVSIHLCAETENHSTAISKLAVYQKETYVFYDKDSQYNLCFFNNTHLHISFPANIKLVALSNTWSHSYRNYKENIFLAFKEVKKFYSNSIKLVDGFKFIIKIPDKPIHSLI